jgi:hypothetical protein
MDSVAQWMKVQWNHAAHLDRDAIVAPDMYEDFDEKVAIYHLWYVPAWPTDVILGRRIRDDGTFHSHEAWVARLYDSIKKHGIKDPVLAYGHHVPTRIQTGNPENLPTVVLGNNRIAIAKHYGIPTIPVVTTVDRGSKPPYDGVRISFERYHDEMMNHRADLWCSPQDMYLVHPPTVFYDESEGGCKKVAPL